MYANLRNLVEILEQEHIILNKLTGLLKGEKECLASFDRQGLDRHNSAVENLTIQMNVLEQSRVLFTEKLAKILQIDPEKATLSYIADHAKKPWNEKLRTLQEEIFASSKKVRALQESNKILLLNGMKVVQGLASVIGETVNPQLTYTSKGSHLESNSPTGSVGRL